jgi:hypothetical protein
LVRWERPGVVSVRTDSYQDWELQDRGSIAAEKDQAPRNTLVRGARPLDETSLYFLEAIFGEDPNLGGQD